MACFRVGWLGQVIRSKPYWLHKVHTLISHAKVTNDKLIKSNANYQKPTFIAENIGTANKSVQQPYLKLANLRISKIVPFPTCFPILGKSFGSMPLSSCVSRSAKEIHEDKEEEYKIIINLGIFW